MFCPNCRAEYRPGFTVCSDCDLELVDELDPAATEAEAGGEGDFDPFALEPFHETWSSDELAVLLDSFEENRIPYVVQAGTALSLLTASAFNASSLPEEWHARILVPGSSLRAAREILKLLRQGAGNPAQAATRPDRGMLS